MFKQRKYFHESKHVRCMSTCNSKHAKQQEPLNNETDASENVIKENKLEGSKPLKVSTTN